MVGNKVDLNNERKVSKQQAEEFANSIKAKYFETSALTDSNRNVKLVFETIGNLMIDKANGQNSEDKKCSICLVF